MGDRISVDFETGNFVIRSLYRLEMAEKVGERTFTPAVRSSIGKKMRQSYKAFREVSEILKEERRLFFGPRAGYTEHDRLSIKEDELALTEEKSTTRFQLINKLALVEVELTGQAKEGLYWFLFMILHPDSKSCWPVGMQEEIAWPLAEKIGALKSLEKETGVEKRESIEVKFDEDLDEEKPAEDKKETAEKPVLQKVE